MAGCMISTNMLLLLTVIEIWGMLVSAFPQNDYLHSLQRDQLIQAERDFARKTLTLTEDEKIVNNYLDYIRWLEFNSTMKEFPPSRPIEDKLEHIVQSDVYRLLRKLPKGGNMHVHEDHLASKKLLLDIVFDSEEFEYLYITPENFTYPWILNFFVRPPEGEPWERVKGNPKYTKEKILQHHTLLGVMTDSAKRYPTDSGERWRQMNPMWSRMTSLLSHVNIRKKHLELIFSTSLDEGVQYLETRRAIWGRLYTLDPNAINGTGQVLLDVYDGELEINETITGTNEFIERNNEFIGLRIIPYASRRLQKDVVEFTINRTLHFRSKYPDYIAAHDLVGEEDSGNSLLYFLDNLVKLYDDATEESIIPAFFHTAETSWLDGQISNPNQYDSVSTLENTYEAVLLGAKRVGHGLGFIKHPYLMQLLRERDVAIEICPVSNQLLGYTPDLRNHPGVNYLRSGIPVVLGSDDPGSFGYDNFTVDWYEVYMAWGVDLADLKQLAINSLNYSSMSEAQKNDAIDNKWNPMWDAYIQTVKSEACTANLQINNPLIANVLPKGGSVNGGTLVHVYGRNFERAVCKNAFCLFGDVQVTAEYRSNQHITCVSPDNPSEVPLQVQLSVSLDDGTSFIDTNVTFSYQYL